MKAEATKTFEFGEKKISKYVSIVLESWSLGGPLCSVDH